MELYKLRLALGHTINWIRLARMFAFEINFEKLYILLKDNLYYVMTIYSVESHQYDS